MTSTHRGLQTQGEGVFSCIAFFTCGFFWWFFVFVYYIDFAIINIEMQSRSGNIKGGSDYISYILPAVDGSVIMHFSMLNKYTSAATFKAVYCLLYVAGNKASNPILN